VGFLRPFETTGARHAENGWNQKESIRILMRKKKLHGVTNITCHLSPNSHHIQFDVRVRITTMDMEMLLNIIMASNELAAMSILLP